MSRNRERINAKCQLKNSRNLPVDKAELSEQSKRSAFLPDTYQTRIDSCVGCGEKILFTASEQKRWYEIWKMYVYSKRNRCKLCQALWHDLKSKVARFPKQLRDECDIAELERMLEALKDYKRLSNSYKQDSALVARIQNKIAHVRNKTGTADA